MNKIININIAGRLLPIDEHAYEQLNKYMTQLTNHFSTSSQGHEILYDLEDRIAELLQRNSKGGGVTTQNVAEVMSIMGQPEEIIAADMEQGYDDRATLGNTADKINNSHATNHAAADNKTNDHKQHTYGDQNYSAPKRLRRDAGRKTIGGVASGIAHYLNIDPIIIKLLFVFMTVLWGFSIVIYIVFWIVLPEAILPETNLRKRLYRNPSQRTIAGVCSGLASYFGTENYIVRLIFLAPIILPIVGSIWGVNNDMWGLMPATILIYLLLMILLPTPRTMTERLEADGKAPTVGNLSAAAMRQTHAPVRRGGSDTFRNILKGLGLIILIGMGFVIFTLLITFILAMIGLSIDDGIRGAHLWQLATTNEWQIVLWYISLFAFLATSLYLIISFMVRIIGGQPKKSAMSYTLYSVLGIWVLSVIGQCSVMGNIAKDFTHPQGVNTEQSLIPSNDTINIIGVDGIANIREYNLFGQHDLSAIYDEHAQQWRLPNVRLQLLPSKDSIVHILSEKSARGMNERVARDRSESIIFRPKLGADTIYLPLSLRFEMNQPFRLQQIKCQISIPMHKYFRWSAPNKRIKLNTGKHNKYYYLKQDRIYYFDGAAQLQTLGTDTDEIKYDDDWDSDIEDDLEIDI